ncbi:MAG: cardiolipin synthase, partial [Parabacteroides sp.]|nr:cardiolipin synthase [Parabacteroides sp.]
AKAKEGVIVRVLYDDVGCWNVKKKFFDEMKESGVEVYAFLKVVFPIFSSKVNYRNHRKIVVIDGKVGFVGGMNIADRYVKGLVWGNWRDLHFKITGKGAQGLQSSFLIDWYVVSKNLITSRDYYPITPAYGESCIQIATSGPVGQWRTLLQAAIFSIANAKNYIYIQTPYFLPTEGINQALQTAALGGVDVRLMLPKRSDARTANMATHSFIDDMLKAGVKVFFYEPGFLHSKLTVIDDAITSIGSANMDFRSFEHNFEISAFVYDISFSQKMKKVFLHDMHHCEQVIPSKWLKRSLKQRIPESFMRLFSPLL